MPIQHAIWQVGAQPQLLSTGKLPSEQLLEEMIVSDPRILSSEWMLIGAARSHDLWRTDRSARDRAGWLSGSD